MEKIGLKIIKRKRKLQSRLKCHGTKEHCRFHQFKKKIATKIKKSWWQRVKEWIKIKYGNL